MTEVAGCGGDEVSIDPRRRTKAEAAAGGIPYTLVGLKVGSGIAKAVMTAAVSSRMPEALGHAFMSATTVRSHVQKEVVHLIAVRVSMHTPQQAAWLIQLVSDYCASASASGAVTALATRSLRYHVTAFGLRGVAASALAGAAVGALCSTCTLITSNAAFWRAESAKMSLRQYRYELATNVYAGLGTVAGSGVGGLIGTALLPGVGTAMGSVMMSVGGGYLVTWLRAGNGPDERRRRYLAEAAMLKSVQTEDFTVKDPRTGELIEGTMLLEPGEMTATEPEAESGGGVVDELAPSSIDEGQCDSTITLERRRRGPHKVRLTPTADESATVVADAPPMPLEPFVLPAELFLRLDATDLPVPAGQAAASQASMQEAAGADGLWRRTSALWRRRAAHRPTAVDSPSPQLQTPPPPPRSGSPSTKAGDACVLAGQVTSFSDDIHDWRGVDRAVESCGAEDVVLVFAARLDGQPLELPT